MHEQLDKVMDLTVHGFARCRYLVEFRAPALWPANTLWLVPGGPAKARLMQAGVHGHLIWSARELREILLEYRAFPGQGVRPVTMADVVRSFDDEAEVVGVHPR